MNATRIFLFSHLFLMAYAACGQETQGSEDQPPNILMILVDDLGNGDLGCMGSQDMETPCLDQFFRDAANFNLFYANSSVCSPTRASLLTGRYPELAGVPGVIRTHAENSWGYLSEGVPLLPGPLRTAGYHTAIVGKWHLGLSTPNRPNDRGFEHFHGFLGDMMDDYYHHRRHGQNYMRLNKTVLEPEGHATDLFTSWACDYLKQRSSKEEPFFLYLAYNAPHTPIQPPDAWLSKVQQREPELALARAKLVALIEHLDDGIGQVLAQLDNLGLSENTVVLFSSDNGGQLNVGANNGRLRDGKQSMYEGGLRVPTAVRWPGVTEAGQQISVPAITMDLFPTICEMAGADIPSDIDGRSLAGLLKGADQGEWDRDLFFHRREGGGTYGGLVINAIRRGPWKLLQNTPFSPQELYNLSADPLETEDLLSIDAKTRNEMRAALRKHVQRGGVVPWQSSSEKDQATRQ